MEKNSDESESTSSDHGDNVKPSLGYVKLGLKERDLQRSRKFFKITEKHDSSRSDSSSDEGVLPVKPGLKERDSQRSRKLFKITEEDDSSSSIDRRDLPAKKRIRRRSKSNSTDESDRQSDQEDEEEMIVNKRFKKRAKGSILLPDSDNETSLMTYQQCSRLLENRCQSRQDACEIHETNDDGNTMHAVERPIETVTGEWILLLPTPSGICQLTDIEWGIYQSDPGTSREF